MDDIKLVEDAIETCIHQLLDIEANVNDIAAVKEHFGVGWHQKDRSLKIVPPNQATNHYKHVMVIQKPTVIVG